MMKFFIQMNFFILWMILFIIIFLILNQIIHPIMMMVFMIMFNIIICMILSMWKFNFIYSIMLFLIMISGLLIIFMYFTSLISNEQMKINLNKKLFILMTLNSLIFFSYLLSNNILFLNKFNYIFFEITPISSIQINKFNNIMNMYIYPFMNFTLINILFILLSFITIIKVNSSSYSFSMRKIN